LENPKPVAGWQTAIEMFLSNEREEAVVADRRQDEKHDAGNGRDTCDSLSRSGHHLPCKMNHRVNRRNDTKHHEVR
jgi:hypothetical protein